MSMLEARVLPITVTPHPNAERLEVGHAFGYQFIVAKGTYQNGDLGVYLMDGSVLPDAIIEAMGVRDYLAGSAKNRVHPVKLRGVLSEGLFYRPAEWPAHWAEGQDVAAELGVAKYEPPVPIGMAGKVTPGPHSGIWRPYDIENLKRYPDVFAVGEAVSLTEKLHGTFCAVGIVGGESVVTSKGFLPRGTVLVEDAKNLYWRAALHDELHAKIAAYCAEADITEALLFGEVFGAGVQDLAYGLAAGHVAFRAFDLLMPVGERQYDYLPVESFFAAMERFGIPTVPEVYRGPFSPEVVAAHTAGRSTLAGHIREDVVIKPLTPRTHDELGRVMLKSVSPDYLTRKGGTEYQ